MSKFYCPKCGTLLELFWYPAGKYDTNDGYEIKKILFHCKKCGDTSDRHKDVYGGYYFSYFEIKSGLLDNLEKLSSFDRLGLDRMRDER